MKSLVESILDDMDDERMDKATQEIADYEFEKALSKYMVMSSANIDANKRTISLKKSISLRYPSHGPRLVDLDVKEIDCGNVCVITAIEPEDVPLVHNCPSVNIVARDNNNGDTITVNITKKQNVGGLSISMPFNGIIGAIEGDVELVERKGSENHLRIHNDLKNIQSLKKLSCTASTLDITNTGTYYKGKFKDSLKQYRQLVHGRPVGAYMDIPDDAFDKFLDLKKWPNLDTIIIDKNTALVKMLRGGWRQDD